MKKTIHLLASFLFLCALSQSQAQNYKHPYAAVSKEGKITDHKGNYLGAITKEGAIKDADGNQITSVNNTGNLVDSKTGKVLGHAPKNGDFVYFHQKGSINDTLTTSAPMTGTCEVKNTKGETKLVVHENYKAYGSCAYHCLMMKKKGKKMKM